MNMNIRLARPEDAEAFAQWAIENPDIPRADIEAAMSENNPTTMVFVAEHEGKVIHYLPFYCLINVAYFGFNPQATEREKIAAMNLMLKAVESFAMAFGIREIQGFSKEGYAMAKWAEHKGFHKEARQAFVRRLKARDGEGTVM
jgi:hypothetical protein